MMYAYAKDIMREVQKSSPASPWPALASQLRTLPLADFAEVLFLPAVLRDFPSLRSFVPNVPPEEVQQIFNSQSGSALLVRSCQTIRMLTDIAQRIRRVPLLDSVILDYGCGWGRLIRLMYYYSDHIYGMDPWGKALEYCRECDVPNVQKCDSTPHT